MILKIIGILYGLLSFNLLFGQSWTVFESKLQEQLQSTSTLRDLDAFCQEQAPFLKPPLHQYPLQSFQKQAIYQKNIKQIFNSKNANHRILAYRLIAAAGDTTFESALVTVLKTEKQKEGLYQAAKSLIQLNTRQTTPLFQFIIDYETFTQPQFLPSFVKLNLDALTETAYAHLDEAQPRAQSLAAQLLSRPPLTSKKEQLLKKAVENWDLPLKGYAVFALKTLQAGDLLPLLKPLLETSRTHYVTLGALANSPTVEDRQYVLDLAEKQDSFSQALLDAFLYSDRIENVKYWLQTLYTKKIIVKYRFNVIEQPLLRQDALLTEVHAAVEKVQNLNLLPSLLMALSGRKDAVSVQYLKQFSKHADKNIRKAAEMALN